MRDLSTFAGQYHLAESPDWQALLTLFELNEGFAFIVLLVANEEGSAVCRDALAKRLNADGKELLELETTPERLKEIADALLLTEARPETGAVWVSRVVSQGAPDYLKWRAAWLRGVSALNQHRNPLRRKWNVPVVFVGAPWLQEVLRENAPDLWSVRTQVAWVEPEVSVRVSGLPRTSGDVPRRGPDPAMALAEAERLRGKKGSELALARMLYRAGLGFASRYQWRGAARALQESLAILPSTASEQDMADTNYELGRVLVSTLDLEEAAAHLRAAICLYRQLGDVLGDANCIKNLGDIALVRSDSREARCRYEEALSLYRRVGSVQGEANCTASLGSIAIDLSNYVEAGRLYEEALALFRQSGASQGEASCIMSLGDIALRRSDHGEAQRLYEQALMLFRWSGSVRGEANCTMCLADIALARSDQGAARQLYQEALPLQRRVGSVQGEATCIIGLGDIENRLANRESAKRFYEQALHLYKQIPEPYSIGRTYQRLAGLATTPEERDRHIEAARVAWLSIDRPDLIKQLDDEFNPSSVHSG